MDIPRQAQLESFEQISNVANIRKMLIIDLLKELGEMTAQEIATHLHKRDHIPTDERNFAAPRITELRKAGKVKPVSKKICDKTGRRVTVWDICVDTYACLMI